MFGFRSDGKKVKNMNIIDKAGPFFMNQRIDAVNYMQTKVPCAPMDEFIARERRINGISYTYMHILFASLVRVMYTRPKLNRFIMRGTTYQRNTISITLDVKKKLEDEGESVTVKFYFTGRESLPEIKKIVDDEINKYTKDNVADDTTKAAKKFTALPDFLFRWALGFARWLDKHGMLGKKLIHASPFHTSCFVTNLKSIKLDYIFHHLYNFGTTSMFFSMGKEKMEPVVENNKEIKIAKIMNMGMSLDDRIADGLYYGKSLKLLKDLLANPDSLMERLPDDGTIPKNMVKKKPKKVKKEKKEKKEKKDKPKKINPRLNKIKHDKKMKKKEEKQEN